MVQCLRVSSVLVLHAILYDPSRQFLRVFWSWEIGSVEKKFGWERSIRKNTVQRERMSWRIITNDRKEDWRKYGCFQVPFLPLEICWPRGSFNDNFRIKRKIEEIWKWFYICKNLINPVSANVPPRSIGQRKNGNWEFIHYRFQKICKPNARDS